MSDLETHERRTSTISRVSTSSESAISVSSSTDEVSMHSTISGDSQLDDHRHQNLSLPIRSESIKVNTGTDNNIAVANTGPFNNNNSNQDVTLKDVLTKQQEQQENQQAQGQKQPFQQQPQQQPQVTTQDPSMSYIKHPTKKKTKRTNSHGSIGSNRPMSKPSNIVNINNNLNSRDLINKMINNEYDDDEYAVKFNDNYNYNSKNKSNTTNLSFALNSNTPIPLIIQQNSAKAHPMTTSSSQPHTKTRSMSFSEQVKSFIRPKEDSISNGILLSNTNNSNINNNDDLESIDSNNSSKHLRFPNTGAALSKIASRASSRSIRRKLTNNSDNNSDIDSHASRESQETEEDVCFPMLPEHIRIRGIDFDEIEEFIIEQNEENRRISLRERELKMDLNQSITTSSEKISSAALKYIPKHLNKNDMNEGTSSSELSEKYDFNNNVNNNNNENVTFNPSGNKQESDEEEEEQLPTRFSFFSSEREETIHAADIPSLIEPGQPFKELFEPADSIWWLDCTCPTDSEMKMLAKAFSIHPLTAEDIRMQETREKVELFKSYYFVSFHTFETDIESEDFLEPINVYIVVFNAGILTFHFSPIINPANVRRRVRQLRDYVNVSADWLCYAMIDDITDGFAPIIQTIEYEADSIEDSVFLSHDNDFGSMLLKIGESRRKVMTLMRLLQGKADVIKMFAKRCQDEEARNRNKDKELGQAQPRADIALYLGDIQDHIITMFQSLLSYEKIFSRSHSNYLAQLQVESFYTNIQVTDMLSKVTILGTILVPMNLITGLFGMNVKVPGGNQHNLGWFGGIIGVIFFIIFTSLISVSYYLKYVESKAGRQSLASGISMKNFRFSRKKKEIDNNNRHDAVSLPTRFTKYGDW